jgi:hypothetical protein
MKSSIRVAGMVTISTQPVCARIRSMMLAPENRFAGAAVGRAR